MDSTQLIAPQTGDPTIDALLRKVRPELIAPPRPGTPQMGNAAPQPLSPAAAAPMKAAKASGAPTSMEPAPIAPEPKPRTPFTENVLSRAEKIQNPVLRALATAGSGVLRGADVAGGALFPRAMSDVPGSTLNTQMQNDQAENNWAKDQQLETERMDEQNRRQNAQREESLAQSENDLRKAEQGQYGMVPITLPDGSTVQVMQKDAERMQAALQGNATRQVIATGSNATRQAIATGSNATRREIATSKPGRAPAAARGGAMTPAQLAALYQRTQNSLRQLDVLHEKGAKNGGIDDATYVDRSIGLWKAVAQAQRAVGDVPKASDGLISLYAAKYANDPNKIAAALRADGWE